MKSNLYLGKYKPEEVFKDPEEEKKVNEMKEVEREKIIAERVLILKQEEERRKLLLNENENKNNESKKNKSVKADLSDSEELGEIKDNKKKSKHKKTVDSNDEDSSLNMNNEDEDKEIEKESATINLEDIKKIVLTRKFFEKYYFYPNFDEKVKGAFVRINLSSTGDLSQPEYTRGYSLDEIEEIVSDKIYDFAGNKCKKGIKLKNLQEVVKFLVVSNSDILEDEFNTLKHGEKPNVPSKEEIEKIQNNIDEIRNKVLTSDELHEIINQKKKDRIKYKDSTLNVTEELDRAYEEYRALKEVYEEKKAEMEDEEKENYTKKMKELDDDIKQLEKMKEERDRRAKLSSENDIVAKINEDIKEKRKMDEKMSLLAKKRKNALNDKEHKLFKRVDCHPSNLFDSGEINVDALNLKKKETSELVVSKTTKKKKHENNFSYAKKIRQFREFIDTKKNLIDEMMEIEKKKIEEKEMKEKNKEENKEENTDKDKKGSKNIGNIDMSLFFKLASINYDMYNKIVKDQNKQNTKDPEIKILGLDEYLTENMKE